VSPRRWGALLAACLAAGAAPPGASARVPIAPRLAALESIAPCGPELAAEVRRFYDLRGSLPAWTEAGGPRPQARELVAALAAAVEEGLAPQAYGAAELALGLGRLGQPSAEELPAEERAGLRADLEIELTRAALLYATHLLRGRVDPASVDPTWYATPRRADLAALLAEAVEENRVGAALAALAPPHADYLRLRRALASYRGLAASGWPEIPAGPALREGDRAPWSRLRPLELRLAAEGYLAAIEPRLRSAPSDPAAATAAEDLVYDAPLRAAVAEFQRRHGLRDAGQPGELDGKLDAPTVEALNVPAAERVRQIELNLERWRWLPGDLGDRHLRVNLPAFGLIAYAGGRQELAMAVVVGRQGWGTPLFHGELDQIVLNPDWNVPETIAAREILPEAQRDPGYLEREGYEVLSGWGAGAVPVDPRAIDWRHVEPESLGYRFRQPPGPRNPLGRIKFVFPNRHSIYLHDTPAREIFRRSARAVSHGCIRVEKAGALALWALGGAHDQDGGWDGRRLDAAISTGETRWVRLPRPLPVFLLYWTAFPAEEPDAGPLHFRADLYGVDKALAEALAAEGG
jgi:murein L,D-transpeptidase YcbB/YkuD